MATYYASSAVSSGGAGTIGDPWPLQTALNNGSQTTGDYLYLRGGTYLGKFTANLAGGTVMSYPDEWAIIDGNKTTTLNGGINSSTTTVVVTSSAGMYDGLVFIIDTEVFYITNVASNTLTVVRNWGGTVGGAVAHSNGATVQFSGNQLTIAGSYTTYRDFEIKSTYGVRDFGTTGHSGIYSATLGAGIQAPAVQNCKFINLLIHDNINGLFIGSSSQNNETYGCLSYNNGGYHLVGAEQVGAGLGIYTENVAGYSHIYNNIFLNCYASGGKGYGQTGPYVGGDVQYNLFANSGAPLGAVRDPDMRTWNFIYGPNDQQSPTGIFSNNHSWLPYGCVGGAALTFGYQAGIGAGTLNDNYLIGGPETLSIDNVQTITGSGNKIYNPGALYVNDAETAVGTFNNNTYYDVVGNNVAFNTSSGGGNMGFAAWQAATGWDASTTTTADPMPDSVHVIPNEYEIGRANIAIYAPSGATSINVNLATTGLTDNQSYTIKNAFNWYGSDVATGVYDAGSTTISVPLNTAAATVATPTGNGFTPATTAPDFVALVVVPGAADASAPGTPTGLTASVGQSNSSTGTFQLAWTLGSGTETSVTVRRIVNGVTTDIPLAADVTSYTDTGQTVGLSYTYAVKASNAAGDSAWSDTVQKVLTGLTCFGAPPSIG